MEQETLRFTGHLRYGDKRFPVQFDTIAGVDFRLKIKLRSAAVQMAVDLHSAMGRPGGTGEVLVLEGCGESGETFFSETVDVGGIRIGSRDCDVSISARSAKISRRASEPLPFPVTRLWFRGFKSMLTPVVRSSLGSVEVRGGLKGIGRDDASGFVAIHADQATDLTDWLSRADELLTFLHRGLAFASGKRLQTPVLEVHSGDRRDCTYFEGEGFSGSLAPIHFMNRGPFVDALVKRFEKNVPFQDSLWTVVGWLHIDTPFDEARFLMSMTAIETLCEHVVPKSKTTLMDKKKYRPLRERLISLVDEAGLTPLETIVLTNRIKQANGLPLSQKLCALREHYKLSANFFTDDAFADLGGLRNDLVHSGRRKGHDVWPKIVFVRELLSQVVFRELDYTGPHESYLNGHATISGANEEAKMETKSAPGNTPG
ncbi:hypothetical protein [Xanthomonas arboricola]|uniref:hypothetical protein n=1 Tax=Xanthomonas arboricola TaxID=56448 RepID=UPI001379462D|nr:hypothetical protein [Xanthomonas arboricola]